VPTLTLDRTDDRLDATFAALGDPTRRAIVDRLALGEATVLELASPFAISLPAISRHLKVLEQAGLIERGRRGRERPCTLRPEAVAEVARWAEHTRRAWEQRLDRLDEFLRSCGTTPTDQAPAPEPEAPAQENDQ
jgi:DNA-binding transcriptional ArsR family regulator